MVTWSALNCTISNNNRRFWATSQRHNRRASRSGSSSSTLPVVLSLIVPCHRRSTTIIALAVGDGGDDDGEGRPKDCSTGARRRNAMNGQPRRVVNSSPVYLDTHHHLLYCAIFMNILLRQMTEKRKNKGCLAVSANNKRTATLNGWMWLYAGACFVDERHIRYWRHLTASINIALMTSSSQWHQKCDCSLGRSCLNA